ncbi:MAG: hypothetical protein QXW10_03730, partial [Candidatus Micrarchaeaceae archaeon]
GSGAAIEVTRRISGGKPIYIDKNVLSYSITGPLNGSSVLHGSTSINNVFGPLIMKAIADTVKSAERLSLGKVYSIEYDGKPIVGNAQHVNASHSFLYHGIAAVGPWDAERINKYLRLRDEDYIALSGLPNIHDIAGDGYTIQEYKNILVKRLHSVLGTAFSSRSDISQTEKEEILKSAALKAKGTYSDKRWILREDINLKEDSRFCLLWPD